MFTSIYHIIDQHNEEEKIEGAKDEVTARVQWL